MVFMLLQQIVKTYSIVKSTVDVETWFQFIHIYIYNKINADTAIKKGHYNIGCNYLVY